MQLADIVLSGTSDVAREKLESLARRAQNSLQEGKFGPLVEDFIFLDTETTGLVFKKCHLIEIAAARISEGKVVDRFQTFVDPKQPIPLEIQKLTHIKDIDVAGAPTEEEAVRELADFVFKSPVIAHNATFDRSFIQKVPGGLELTDLWIDSLALSRIALPRLSSHRLSDMAEAFGCDTVTHRAMDDVDALVGMWPIFLQALLDFPRGLLSFFAQMHPEVEWPYRLIFKQLADVNGVDNVPFSLHDVRQLLLEGNKKAPKLDSNDLVVAPMSPTKEEIAGYFKEDGLVSHMYDNYESRPEQVKLAEEIRRACQTSSYRVLEAGTGVGKSIAYLLPEICFAKKNNVSVGVATKTNALTDQLVSHELPALDKVFKEHLHDKHGVSFTSLKGYEHYPCLMRIENAAKGELPDEAAGKSAANGYTGYSHEEMLTALAVNYAYACISEDGDLDALGIRWNKVPREMLTISARECLRTKCPFYPHECLVHGARRRAAASDVVITNHSLLLKDVDLEGRILPPIRHWVVDEAHSFEKEARRQWAIEITNDAVRDGFERLGSKRMGMLHQIYIAAEQMDANELIVRLATKLNASSSRAQVSSANFFKCVHDLSRLTEKSAYDSQLLWLSKDLRQSPEWAKLSEAGELVCERLAELAHDAAALEEALKEENAELAAELGDAAGFAKIYLHDIRLIIDGTDDSYVFSAQLRSNKKQLGQEGLLAEKIEVGKELAERWYPEMESVVYCSATMAVGESFEHFNHAVGLDLLDRGGRSELQIESSFDYDNNMAVVVASDMPQPSARNYLDKLVDLLVETHLAMDGSVLTLFTNRREMEKCYELVQPKLAQAGLALSKQDKNSSARFLRDAFIKDKRRSLFALKSFWEGFDAGGETLRCVVIPKLPFSSPNDPLSQERQLRDERAWWNYALPEAVIEMRQAAGRLIRSSTDQGILVLADSRVLSKSYGKTFLRSLPNKHSMNLDSTTIPSYIKTWRKYHEH